MISLLLLFGLGLGILYRLSERLPFTDLLPDFSHGFGFCGLASFIRGLESNSIYCSLMQIRRKVRELFFFPSDQLFQLDKVFYAGIGYLLVFGIVYSIGRLLGLLLHLIPSKKLGGKLFQVSAGILSMLVTLFVLQMTLTILATIPMAAIQNPLEKSIVAKHIIQSIPVTTSWLKQIWVTNLIG